MGNLKKENMQSDDQTSTSLPRKYNAISGWYTPLDTQRLPRPGRTNDLFYVAPRVIGVILQDGSVVLVDADDYHLLQVRGWTARWTARKVTGDNTYPSINHGDRIRPISRIILDARKGERVWSRNGDRNDLRRANLVLKAKGGLEIGFSNRLCQQAPILSRDERGRVIAAVASAVGSASLEDRVAVAQESVRRALPSIQTHRATTRGPWA